MGINWQMGVSDPMQGINNGLASLGQALQNRQQMDRQAMQDQRQNTLADLQLQKYQREETNRAGLQSLIQSQSQPRPVPNPAYQSPELGPQPDPMQPATIQQPMDERAKAEEVQRYLTARSMFDELRQFGQATDLTDKIDERKRKGIAQVQGAGAFAYSKAIEGGADKITASKAAAQAAIAQAQTMGMPTDGMENAQYDGNVSFTKAPEEIGGYMSTVFDPMKGTVDIKHIAAAKQPDAGAHNVQEIPSPDGKTARKMQYNPKTQRYDIPVGQPYTVKSQVPKIEIKTGTKERDLPTGIQDKLSAKLEIYNDWSTLKNGFKPEYMPKTPFKNIGEFQINLNKIFGNNQAAVDWWTQYFDARNIILKERSGAAVMEPEFRRFEQGTIAANTNPQSVVNYLDRSSKKYKQHVDSYLEANRKNHPESIKAFEDAYGYAPPKNGNTGKVRTIGKYAVEVH